LLWSTGAAISVQRRDIGRSAAVFAAAIAVGLLAFSPLLEQTPNRGPLAFLAILPLMWAALRRDQRDTATTVLILSCFAVWGTLSDGGPFARAGSLNDSFLLLLAFMIGISVPSLALSADVTRRKYHEEHVELVMQELSHRSKNLLSVVQSMAYQIARHTDNFEDFDSAFRARLGAFADTHDLLVTREWRGADIRDLIRTQLDPFRGLHGTCVVVEGPPLTLNPRAAEQIGLALHELATHAATHGAFSIPSATVSILWQIEAEGPDKGHLRISWKEDGSDANRREQSGFGNLVITKIVPLSLRGRAVVELRPQGVIWTLIAPVSNVLA
jgi:two-component sensor histidine kinase